MAAEAAASPPRTAAALHVVLGNQACDTDSVVSAIVHAYALHHASSLRCVPVVSCSRDDFAIKRDTQLLLLHAASSTGTAFPLDALLFTDDLPTLLESTSSLAVHLVDHNKLDCAALMTSTIHDASHACIVEIVDHHADAGAHTHVHGASRCINFNTVLKRGVGSCCTLVAQRALARCAEGVFPMDAGLARMLWSVILLDTGNFDPALGKGTAEDVDAAAALEAIVMPSASQEEVAEERRRVYDLFYNARADPSWWDTLPPRSVLRADYKAFDAGGVRYGASSMSMHVLRFLRRAPAPHDVTDVDVALDAAPTEDVTVHPHTLAACVQYAEEQRVAFLLLLSRCGSMRQLTLIHHLTSALTPHAMHAVCTYMEAHLPLVRVSCSVDAGAAARVRAYLLTDLALTRKQVAPIADAALAHAAAATAAADGSAVVEVA